MRRLKLVVANAGAHEGVQGLVAGDAIEVRGAGDIADCGSRSARALSPRSTRRKSLTKTSTTRPSSTSCRATVRWVAFRCLQGSHSGTPAERAAVEGNEDLREEEGEGIFLLLLSHNTDASPQDGGELQDTILDQSKGGGKFEPA